jgi:hypothetical protein
VEQAAILRSPALPIVPIVRAPIALPGTAIVIATIGKVSIVEPPVVEATIVTAAAVETLLVAIVESATILAGEAAIAVDAVAIETLRTLRLGLGHYRRRRLGGRSIEAAAILPFRTVPATLSIATIPAAAIAAIDLPGLRLRDWRCRGRRRLLHGGRRLVTTAVTATAVLIIARTFATPRTDRPRRIASPAMPIAMVLRLSDSRQADDRRSGEQQAQPSISHDINSSSRRRSAASLHPVLADSH